jgi:hypothetical protein
VKYEEKGMREKWVLATCKVLSRHDLGWAGKPHSMIFGPLLEISELESEELPMYAVLYVDRRNEKLFHIIKISFLVGL